MSRRRCRRRRGRRRGRGLARQNRLVAVARFVDRLGLDALDAQQLRLENQRASRGNRTNTLIAVRQTRWNRQLPALANAHAQQPLVPTVDDLVGAELELEWPPAVEVGVELRAVSQRALVLHRDRVAILCFARAFYRLGDGDVKVLREREGGQNRERSGEEPHGGGTEKSDQGRRVS